jgi:hypothetical protein
MIIKPFPERGKKQSLPTQDEPEGLRQLVYDWDMRLIMNDESLQALEQVRQFLGGSKAVEFRGLTAKEKYRWIEEVLIRFRYHRLKREEKRVIRRYIGKVTGYSRSQGSRLIKDRPGCLQCNSLDHLSYLVSFCPYTAA